MKQRKAKTYFIKQPCAKGHISKRYMCNGGCVQCHRIYMASWREDKIKKCPEFFMLKSAKRRANEKGLSFNITAKNIREVWPKNNRCPVLNVKLLHSYNGSNSPNSPSLDRKSPSKGYVKGNIAVISTRANTIKSDEINPKIFIAIANYLKRCCL